MGIRRLLLLALIGVLLPIATPQVRLNMVSAWERPEVQEELDRWLLRGASGTAGLIRYADDIRSGVVLPTVIRVNGVVVGQGEVDTSADFALTHGQTFAEPGEIEAILKGWNSPAAGSGGEILAAARQNKIDAAYGLAMCQHESGCGTAGPNWAGYIGPNQSSMNPGNIICAPGQNEWWDGSCYGRFRRYASWGKGFGDLFALLAYYRDELGDKTIEDALYRWAPPSDGNNQNRDCTADPSSYPCAVKAMIGAWRNVKSTSAHAPQASTTASGAFVEPWPGFFKDECAGLHAGARDYCSPEGTEVRAPLAGRFLQTGRYEDDLRYGDYLMFVDDAGREWYFGHLKNVNPKGWKAGDRVQAGDPLGMLGPFAHSTPHTHNQLRINGVLTDPGPVYAELRRTLGQ